MFKLFYTVFFHLHFLCFSSTQNSLFSLSYIILIYLCFSAVFILLLNFRFIAYFSSRVLYAFFSCHYFLFAGNFGSEMSVVISPELVIEVEARMNREYTPPSLIPGTSTPSTSMSMNNCVGVPPNTQARPIQKTRRTGLPTVMEGPGLIYGILFNGVLSRAICSLSSILHRMSSVHFA